MSLLIGDCREQLREYAAGGGERAQTCITSPPYWGLRDYGVEGQLGLEETPEQYVANMVEVFACVRDVLVDDGTLWVNIGDSYYAAGWECRRRNEVGSGSMPPGERKSGKKADGLKVKDLVGIPWLLAFALRADGWYLRQDIIWSKPNPMPESVTDRCTKAHEYLFLLSKSARYYYDAEAIAEKSLRSGSTPGGNDARGLGQFGVSPHAAFNGLVPETRNKRSVWSVASAPYADAHFATFPPKLIEPCVLAGSRPGDLVLDPFMGSGTTAQVAQHLGRRWLGCELNPEYGAMVERRVAQQAMMLEIST